MHATLICLIVVVSIKILVKVSLRVICSTISGIKTVYISLVTSAALRSQQRCAQHFSKVYFRIPRELCILVIAVAHLYIVQYSVHIRSIAIQDIACLNLVAFRGKKDIVGIHTVHFKEPFPIAILERCVIRVDILQRSRICRCRRINAGKRVIPLVRPRLSQRSNVIITPILRPHAGG